MVADQVDLVADIIIEIIQVVGMTGVKTAFQDSGKTPSTFTVMTPIQIHSL